MGSAGQSEQLVRALVALRLLSEEQLSTTELGERLGVNQRTAQRIILGIRAAEIPVHEHRTRADVHYSIRLEDLTPGVRAVVERAR